MQMVAPVPLLARPHRERWGAPASSTLPLSSPVAAGEGFPPYGCSPPLWRCLSPDLPCPHRDAPMEMHAWAAFRVGAGGGWAALRAPFLVLGRAAPLHRNKPPRASGSAGGGCPPFPSGGRELRGRPPRPETEGFPAVAPWGTGPRPPTATLPDPPPWGLTGWSLRPPPRRPLLWALSAADHDKQVSQLCPSTNMVEHLPRFFPAQHPCHAAPGPRGSRA